ncbi:MAG: NAD(P)-dependent oxidoreductase [Myxococcota bacterium]
MTNDGPLEICLGFPPFFATKYVERLETLDGVRVSLLPIDPDGDWVGETASEPWSEPPPWAEGVAAERAEALARADVLVTLHTPDRLWSAHRGCAGSGRGGGRRAVRAGGLRPRPGRVDELLGRERGVDGGVVMRRLLQVWKRFREADAYQSKHAFERTYGRTFAGSTIGIVGLGHIGREVARRARAFGCPHPRSAPECEARRQLPDVDVLYPASALHELLAASDAVIAAPATEATRHLIDRAALAAMKRDAVLVNVARARSSTRWARAGDARGADRGGRARRIRSRAPRAREPALGPAERLRLGPLLGLGRSLHGRCLRALLREREALPRGRVASQRRRHEGAGLRLAGARRDRGRRRPGRDEARRDETRGR